METNKKEWYSQQLAKLKRIESGGLSLTDYISEVEEKLRQPNGSGSLPCHHFFVPTDQSWKRCSHCGMIMPLGK